jgi:RNA recognition motif-containing protein
MLFSCYFSVMLQVCVQGIPWKYTWKELKELLAECGEVERADVMTAPDGRSKVRS